MTFGNGLKVAALLLVLVGGSARADFDSDFASFEKDFDRLNQMSVRKHKPKQVSQRVAPAEDDLDEHEVDPSDPERLGYSLEDPVMREKVSRLYDKKGIRVYSYVLGAE